MYYLNTVHTLKILVNVSIFVCLFVCLFVWAYLPQRLCLLWACHHFQFLILLFFFYCYFDSLLELKKLEMK